MSQQTADTIRSRYGVGEQSIVSRLRKHWVGYLFILPTFVMFTLLFYYPILQGIYMTFTNTRLGQTGEFVGLANYAWLITNDLFQFSFAWTLGFVFGSTALQLVIGLVTALLLHELVGRRRDWLAAIIMSPYFSAPLAGGIIWWWFLNPSFGFVPRFVASLLPVSVPGFLSEGFWPYVSLIVAQAWHDYGYAGIIYAAALVNVPSEQYEAAALAGANRLRRFRDVTLPHLRTPTIIILALRTAWNIAEFAQPFELTAGGPGTRTMLLSILTYQKAYVDLNFGRAYTVGVSMIVISMSAALFYVTVINEEEDLYV
ncbi:MAG: carbohydrate ABC transporter permease [Haloferacaceae archaeon]